MMKRVQRWLAPAVCLALAWSLAAAAPAAAPAVSPGDGAKSESPAEKVRKALDQTLDVVIENQPLELAVQQLAEQTKLNFVIDRLTVQQLGIDLQGQGAPVSLRLTQVKLRTALRSLLGQYNLSYAILGEAVVITSEEAAVHRQLRQRVSVEADQQPLAAALKQLARETAVNVVVDSRLQKEAQTAVTIQLEDVPLETAVRLMAEMAGLKPVRVGNVLFVTTKTTAAELKAETNAGNPPPGNSTSQIDAQMLRLWNLNGFFPGNQGFIPFNNIIWGR